MSFREHTTKEEGKAYIKKKLEAAGCLEAILNASNGTPRIVNKLCNMALLIANSQGKMRVELESAEKAISDIQLG